MQYRTRYLPTGTAVTSNLHTPHQHGSPPCLNTSTESNSLHRHTQSGQRTRVPPRLRNVYLRKSLTWLHRRQPFHTNLSMTSWNWTPQWDKSSHTFPTWFTIEDIQGEHTVFPWLQKFTVFARVISAPAYFEHPDF